MDYSYPDSELVHFGVKGMKWGVRRDRGGGGGSSKGGSKSSESSSDDAAAKAARKAKMKKAAKIGGTALAVAGAAYAYNKMAKNENEYQAKKKQLRTEREKAKAGVDGMRDQARGWLKRESEIKDKLSREKDPDKRKSLSEDLDRAAANEREARLKADRAESKYKSLRDQEVKKKKLIPREPLQRRKEKKKQIARDTGLYLKRIKAEQKDLNQKTRDIQSRMSKEKDLRGQSNLKEELAGVQERQAKLKSARKNAEKITRDRIKEQQAASVRARMTPDELAADSKKRQRRAATRARFSRNKKVSNTRG
jgi:hypothetical protein